MDKYVKLAIIAAVSVLVAAIAGPFIVESYQRKMELRNEAFAIHNEISHFQSTWIHIREQRVEHYTSTSPMVFFPEAIIYPKSGLYYVYGKDVFRFSPKLSEELSNFYRDATSAESYREDLVQFTDRTTYPMKTTFTHDLWNEYDTMIGHIVEAVNISQEGTLNRLDEVQTDWFPFA